MLVNNLLDAWALFDPNRILVKMKLHVLAHLPDDIRRFGLIMLYSTEIFECWNAIFRMCSILSNHLAPSHDIAVTLADMERFKHLVSGGWWKNEHNEMIQAGEKVRNFLARNRELQRRLGWVSPQNMPQSGECPLYVLGNLLTIITRSLYTHAHPSRPKASCSRCSTMVCALR